MFYLSTENIFQLAFRSLHKQNLFNFETLTLQFLLLPTASQ